MSDQQPPQDPSQPPVGGPPPGQPPVPPPPPPPPPPPGQPYGGPNPAGTYGVTPGYGGGAAPAVPSTNNNAIVAFVLSLVSWVVCPIICAIVALVFASKAKKEIEQSGGWQTGSGFVTAAKIISWLNIVLGIIGLILYIIIIAVVVTNPNTFPEVYSTPRFNG